MSCGQQPSSSSMADRLGLGNEVHKFRLGDSFLNKDGNSACFHTIRYDFKPASMDHTKTATMDVGEANQVSVTVPHIEGAGTSQTVYKGSKKPYHKECVLIIDRNTGEIVLEKLTSNMQLKKTRAEGSSRMHPRPITPVDPIPSRWNSPSGQQKLSPAPVSPSQRSPTNQQQQLHQKSSPSRPTATAHHRLQSKPPLHHPPTPSKPTPPRPQMQVSAESSAVGVLSDSSSSSDGGSDSSDSEPESKAPCPKPSVAKAAGAPAARNRVGASSFPTSSFPSVFTSQPYSQLNEDLQLSESGSESD
jgi:ELL-associated factor